MDFKDFTAGKDDDGRRFDRVIRIFLDNKSLAEIYKLLRKGLIKLNHKKAKPDSHISQGDVISIAAFLLDEKADNMNYPASQNISSQNTKLNIVFENEHLLILDKPYNKTVHGDKDGLYRDVENYYKSKPHKDNSSISFRPGPLHRLDRLTSGLIVFSMSLEGARWFSSGIKNHTISKKYYGLAQGKIQNDENWCDKLTDGGETEDGFYTVKEAVSGADDGVEAITIVHPLAYGKYHNTEVTLAEYAIKTGRKHQIRAQSMLHSHPLLGDTAYGAKKINSSREFYLQAYELSFPENELGLPPFIRLPLASDFAAQLQCCEIENPGL